MPRGTCRHAAGHEAWDPSSCAVPQLLLSQLQFARGRAGGERGATVWLVGLLMLAQHPAARAGLLRQAFGVRWDGRTSMGAHAGGNGIKVLKLGRRGVPVISISTLPESSRLKIVRLTLNSHDQKKKKEEI